MLLPKILFVRRIVKLTSPNLNYIMICGVFAQIYSAIPIVTYSIATQSFKCNVREMTYHYRKWCYLMFLCQSQRLAASWGYTVCIGVVIAKTSRVYHIFKTKTARKQVGSIYQKQCRCIITNFV